MLNNEQIFTVSADCKKQTKKNAVSLVFLLNCLTWKMKSFENVLLENVLLESLFKLLNIKMVVRACVVQ